MLQALPGIKGRYYFAIFVLASATISLPNTDNALLQRHAVYHFAFFAISLAMLGLTRGAMEVYTKPARYGAERVAGGIRPPRLMVRDQRRWRDDRLPVRAASGPRPASCRWLWRSPRRPS